MTKSIMKTLILCALSLIILASPAFGKVDVVKIGIVYPLSGTSASTGNDYVAAYQLAAEIINNVTNIDFPFAKTVGIPSLGNAKIEFVPADSQGNAEVGKAEAERLITTVKPAALMGCHHSAVTKTASQAAEQYGIPFLCPDSTSPALTERGYEFFFRSGPTDTTFIEDAFNFIADIDKAKGTKTQTVALISEDTEFGKNILNVEKELATKLGYKIVETITFANNSTSLSSEVLRLKQANPDVIFMAAYTSDTILFMKTLKEQKYYPRAIIGQRAGFIAPELFSAIGKDGEYLFTTNVWAADLGNARPIVKVINDMYKKKTGKDLTGDYARAFTGAFVMADAINRAASLAPIDIKKALLATNLSGKDLIVPWEGVKFDQTTHQNIYGKTIITQFINGQYRTVWPLSLASTPVVWPVPSWDKR